MSTKPQRPPLGWDDLSRLEKKWWWWHPGTKDQWQLPGAHEWELLRRTNFYPALWAAHQRVISSLKQRPAAPTASPASLAPAEWLLSHPDYSYHSIHLANLVGSTLQTFLLHELDPAVSWVDLSEAQRRAVRSSGPVGQRMRLPEEHEMALGMAYLLPKSPQGIAVGKIRWSGNALTISGAVDSAWFQSLSIKEATPYLVIRFMVDLPLDALKRGLNLRLDSRLGGKSPSLEGADRASVRPDEQKRLSNTAPWWPSEISPSLRQHDQRIRVVPGEMNREAFCLIPSCDNLGTLRGHFARAIRPESRAGWEPECERFWRAKRMGAGVSPSFQPTGKLAVRKDLEFGLAVLDTVSLAGVRSMGKKLGNVFDYLDRKYASRADSVTTACNQADSTNALNNQMRSVRRWLADLDAEYVAFPDQLRTALDDPPSPLASPKIL